MIAVLLSFTVALLVGLYLPRLPLVIIPRLRPMEGNLTLFPNAQPVNVDLVAQLLLLRRLWQLSFMFALLPLLLGLFVLSVQPDPVAFGLFIGGGWAILSRILPEQGLELPAGPYSMTLIGEVDQIRRAENDCCDSPDIRWEVTAIRCRSCRSVHLTQARPDLGRSRTDGLVGAVRLLILDGHPLLSELES